MGWRYLLIWASLFTSSSQLELRAIQDHLHREGSGSVNVEVKTPILTRIEEFHGHVGPYVVLGYKMGLLAKKLLDSPGYFDMTVEVESPLAPPPSCLIDGIQLGSGCTTGKRNLTVKEGPIGKATFRTRTGRSVVLSLRQEIPEKVRQWIEEMGVEKSGIRILEASTAEFVTRSD